jgi:hypothetical protein
MLFVLAKHTRSVYISDFMSVFLESLEKAATKIALPR